MALMTSIGQGAHALTRLLGERADALARSTGFLQRQRCLTGRSVAQALVWGWLAAPQSTLAQLAQACGAAGTPVSRQAIDQRLNAAAAVFLRALLREATQIVVTGAPVVQALLSRCGRVTLLDSTVIALPAALVAHWQGCGNGSGEGGAALKVQALLELTHGALTLHLRDGRSNDHPAYRLLPADGLAIADLGYFGVAAFATRVRQGGHVLSRLLSTTALFLPPPAGTPAQRVALLALLAGVRGDRLDRPILLGSSERWPCRLLAQRLADQEAALRFARQTEEARTNGTPLPADAQALSHWLLLVTSLAADRLGFAEAVVLYRLRWQVELLFKRWKSLGRVDDWRSQRPERVLCEVYAKLLAALITQWLCVVAGWQRADKSLWQMTQAIRGRAPALLSACTQGVARLRTELRLLRDILGTCRMTARSKQPLAFQRLAQATAAP
jgi:hypothetical protein